MTSRFTELVVDCADIDKMASFWCSVLGYQVTEREDDYVEIGAAAHVVERILEGPPVPTIVFVKVSEPKTVKDRIHVDVNPIDATQGEEVNRLLALGATMADVGQGEQGWIVMADPEGNEFCVLKSLKPGE
jgi:catechol 2,3-dioxygenase-like lactoylglutathione lyase family enzyme